ncbi:MAG TPA: ATP-binding protein, partial [Ktedonobacterales bacterium]|nr:ATP-binding protein [Ktedonobacterales bacterium]
MLTWRQRFDHWQNYPAVNAGLTLAGVAAITVFVALIDRFVELPNPGIVYLPFIAMVAYYWNWYYGILSGFLDLVCVYFFFIPPANRLKALRPQDAAQLITLAAVIVFILALVQFARSRRDMAEREAGRFAALNSVSASLSSELDEGRLLHLIARRARDLTSAEFAAFTLRPIDALGQPLVPAEGRLFHLAAVVGVTPEQEALFRRVPLGGEGLLAPIFRHGMPVRVADALEMRHTRSEGDEAASTGKGRSESPRDAARRTAEDFAHGLVSREELRTVGVPRGHPVVRSFLGAPLLDRNGEVRGGLLLGHSEPDCFSDADEALLHGLAAQAAVALENARLFRSAQAYGQELDAIFQSINDGVALVDEQGHVLRENGAARQLMLELMRQSSKQQQEIVLREAAQQACRSEFVQSEAIRVHDDADGEHEYLMSATPFHPLETKDSNGSTGHEQAPRESARVVIVWHDVTETRRLLAERQARAETERQRALLQNLVNELPSGVYLVRGTDARLVLANRAAEDVWGARWPEGQSMAEFLAANGTRFVRADGYPLDVGELATVRAVRTGESVQHYQEIVRRPDGTTLPILLNAVVIDPWVLPSSGDAADADTPTALEPVVLVVLQDVTALKEAERLKDEFIAIAAHELKTPMAALKGYANMLTRTPAGDEAAPLEDWQVEALETIDQATTRLVELTDDLLDVARLQSGRLELRLEPYDLVALARRVTKRLQVMSNQHTLMLQSPADYVVALIDVPRMEQVVTNLVSNAIKYSPDGGEVIITIREDTELGVAEFCVQDHGIGIPSAQQALMFGRFARAENAHDRGIKGTGLGLYLSRELVERHGGHIWFESTEGEGSRFYVTVPLAR